jgi:hypothetical protein
MDQCSICANEQDANASIDSCKHTFCEDCIVKWSKNENSCPLCRKKFHEITFDNKIIKVEDKKQKVPEDDFMPDDYENEVYHRPPTIDERLEPYEIGTIVKKRNTNIKKRFKYVIYKRYYLTNELRWDFWDKLWECEFIRCHGCQSKNNPYIYDVHFCNFDYPSKIIGGVLGNGCPIWEPRYNDVHDGHLITYIENNTHTLPRGYSHSDYYIANLWCRLFSDIRNHTPYLHYIDIETYSLHKTHDWWACDERLPDWVNFCPETSWYNLQRHIITYYTKKELKHHLNSLKYMNNTISNNNNFNKKNKNFMDMSHIQRIKSV